MKLRTVTLGLCMVMCLSACSMSKHTQEISSNTESVTSETEEENDMEQDPDLVLLDQGATVEICDGAIIAQIQEPYSGVFWEDEEHEEVTDIYYVKFTNCTDFMIETADITLGDDEGELLFHIDMLQAGESVLVAEANKTVAASKSIRYIDSHIDYIEESVVISDLLETSMKKDTILSVKNKCGDFLHLVKIYYAPFNKENERVSGMAYAATIDGLESDQELEVEVDDWQKTFQIITVTTTKE